MVYYRLSNNYSRQLLQQSVVSVVIKICLVSHLTNGEIHRAKSVPNKSPKRDLQPTLDGQVFEADLDVATMLEVDGSQDSGGGGLVGLDLGAEDNTTACGSTRQFYEIWMLSVLGSTLVGLSGIFPVFVIPLESGPGLKHGEPAKKLRLMLSFAVGTLLGDVFLHLLPEVWAHIDSRNHNSHTRIGLWVICGLLAFMIVEKLMGDEQDFDHEETKHEDKMDMQIQAKKTGVKSSKPKNKMGSRNTTSMVKLKGKQNGESANSVHSKSLSLNGVSPASPKGTVSHIKTSGYLNLIANVVDNFTHGLAVAGSFCISNKMGLMTTIAILLHEVPHEVGDFAILLRSGFDRWAAAKVQFLTASGGIIGAITALTAESVQIAGERTAWILPFTSGGFMYIALVTVVPDLLQEKHGWESLKQIACICFGVLTMLSVTLAFE